MALNRRCKVRALFHPALLQGAVRLMNPTRSMTLAAVTLTACLASPAVVSARDSDDSRDRGTERHKPSRRLNVQVGPRPYYLVEDMDESALKRKLQQCSEGPFYKTEFSIGHRGAPLQFPEHTKESYEAAARMGAGILECDVTFTKDRQLVCRHSQCDLHTTTTILASPALATGGGFYYQSVSPAINNDGDMYVALDVLARHVGIIGMFSDWPGTVTYYANCMGL